MSAVFDSCTIPYLHAEDNLYLWFSTNETWIQLPFNRNVYDYYKSQQRPLLEERNITLKIECQDNCDQVLYRIVDGIIKYNVIPAIVLAIIGFVLVLVAIAPDVRKSSANWYILMLTFWETNWLLWKTLSEFEPMRAYFRSQLSACRYAQFMLPFLELNSVYVLLAMTAERAYVVFAPLKASSVLSLKLSTIATGVVLVGAFVVAIPTVVMFTTGRDHLGIPTCVSYAGVLPLTAPLQHEYVLLIMNSYLPTILLFLMNASIIIKLREHGKQKAGMTSSTDKARPNRQELQITVMLVTASVVYMLLSFPYTFNQIYRNTLNLYMCIHEEKYAVSTTVASVTKNMSHAINAYIYCLSSATFRNQLTGRCRAPKKTNKQSTATFSTAVSQ